jgi:hypothetical protein
MALSDIWMKRSAGDAMRPRRATDCGGGHAPTRSTRWFFNEPSPMMTAGPATPKTMLYSTVVVDVNMPPQIRSSLG